MFAPVIGSAYTMTTKRDAHWSEQTKAQNTEKGMCVGLKQPRGDGERYVTPARAAAKETTGKVDLSRLTSYVARARPRDLVAREIRSTCGRSRRIFTLLFPNLDQRPPLS